jgi:hypothetical protein
MAVGVKVPDLEALIPSDEDASVSDSKCSDSDA